MNNLLIQELFGFSGVHSFFLADAVSCYKEQHSTTSCNGISFVRFIVEFWNEKSIKMQPIFQAVIHVPSCWSLQHFFRCYPGGFPE
jgi:hypothetical protein